MHKKLFSFLLLLLPSIGNACSTTTVPSLTSLTPPPFFMSKLTTHFYCGQDINTLNIEPFDPYTVFQYIYDFGIDIDEESIRETGQTFSLVALARVKGLFGNVGSGLVPLQEDSKGQFWLREAYLKYAPIENKNNFVKAGFFPFKVGNGFVLGNAYSVDIPISWQYTCEQIDQFRPGVLLELGNRKKSFTADAYVGFILVHNSVSNPLVPPFGQNAIDTALENLDAVFVQYGTKNVVTSLQLNIGPFENHDFQLSPYVFFQKNDQFVEFTNDSTNTLCTPGLCGFFQCRDLRISFEAARNFGHQYVKAWDRNIVNGPDGMTNTQLFYAPDPTTTLANANNADFALAPFFIPPNSLTAQYGNGTDFLYPTAPNATSVFKNSYDRLRNSYYNNYAGYVLFLDFLLTKKNLTWGLAGVYASGANDPNDSYDTILLTRLTPGVKYKDYDKTYKGFIGVNQLSDAMSINGLYFGAGDYRYTNLAFVGTTVQYSFEKNDAKPLSAQATLVSYFKPTAVRLDITNQHNVTLNTPLPHYLGTEFNWSASYTVGPHFSFTMLGGIFFPGAFYKDLQQQLASVELETLQLFDPTLHSIPNIAPQKAAFFVSFSLSLFFDSFDIKKIFKQA